MFSLLGADTWKRGTTTFIVSSLLRYTRTLRLDFLNWKGKNTKNGTHTKETLS